MMSREFATTYLKYIGQVRDYVKELIPNEYKEFKVYQPVQYMLMSTGKMIRPFLLMLSCDAVGGNSEKIVPLACGIELGHLASLVHDDVIDRGELRRGKISVHEKFGIPSAILSGDVLIFHAFHELAKTAKDVPSDGIVKALEAVAKTGIEMALGEELESSYVGKLDLTVEEYIKVISLKTATYLKTICKVGAILGGGNDEMISGLEEYGMNLGIAFQIVDDLLDVTKGEEEIKKTGASDLKNKVIALPIILALQYGNAASKKIIQTFFSNPSPTPEDFGKLVMVLRRSGTVEHVKEFARNYSKKAKDALKVLPPSNSVQILRELADFVVERGY